MILSSCQVMIEFVLFQAKHFGIDVTTENTAYNVCWQGTRCLAIAANWFVIGVCVAWVPLLGLVWKFGPSMASNVAQMVRRKSKLHFIVSFVDLIREFID